MTRYSSPPRRIAAACTLLLVALLLLSSGAAVAQEGGVEVFALQGTLRQAVGQPFSTYLVVADGGRTFGLFGRTPAVDQQIEQFRSQNATVRVWGILFPEGRISELPEIIVDSIVSITAQPTATPVPTANPTPTVVVNGESVNIRSGPSTAFPSIGVVTNGTNCTANGRNADATWLRVVCPSISGWISAPLVTVFGSAVNLPVIATGPPPTPAAQFRRWKASYFDNAYLQGTATVVIDEPGLTIDWGRGSPHSRIPVDFFSARFERTITYQPDNYRISLTVDDGARVWIDNQIVIDDWRVGSRRTLQVERRLDGATAVVVEYFEASGDASISLAIASASIPPTPTPVPSANELTAPFDQWAAAYWNNRGLSGQPVNSRFEQRSGNPLERNWGTGSPIPGVIGEDNWSARWQGVFQFSAGDHVFRAVADDGVRVRINGIPIIDAWSDGHKDVSNTFRQIGAGRHTITVEFYENTGNAYVTVLWTRVSGSRAE